MGGTIPYSVKNNVLNQWLSGISRDQIAKNNEIGAGTVSSIIEECRKINDPDFELLRSVAVMIKKKDWSLDRFASCMRLKQKMGDMDLDEDSVESFLENITVHCFKKELDPQEFVDKVQKSCTLSDTLGVSVDKLPFFITEKNNELCKLTEKVEDVKYTMHKAVLDFGLTIDELEEYKRNKPTIEDNKKIKNMLEAVLKQRDDLVQELCREEIQNAEYQQRWFIPGGQIELANKYLDIPIDTTGLIEIAWQLIHYLDKYTQIISVLQERISHQKITTKTNITCT